VFGIGLLPHEAAQVEWPGHPQQNQMTAGPKTLPELLMQQEPLSKWKQEQVLILYNT
jgi:hypothetical protein